MRVIVDVEGIPCKHKQLPYRNKRNGKFVFKCSRKGCRRVVFAHKITDIKGSWCGQPKIGLGDILAVLFWPVGLLFGILKLPCGCAGRRKLANIFWSFPLPNFLIWGKYPDPLRSEKLLDRIEPL